jgi:1,4-dihydroxy-6-naphthoate synthase
MAVTQKRTLTLGHSPDPDDAFMFYALAKEKIDTRGWRFEHILQDIQTLNERAMRGELDITAISIHAYAYVADKYALLASGASMGLRYGPMVVGPNLLTLDELKRSTIAVPGTMTSAFLTLRLAIGDYPYEVVPFDRIIEEVVKGRFAAGLIIHEGQLTYAAAGLVKVLDLGEWWWEKTRLPLPLGGNVVRRDLGAQAIAEISQILRESIRYGLEHRAEAVNYALQWARDMGFELADQFVGMYVNELTLDYGQAGRQGVEKFLTMAAEHGYVPEHPKLEFV